MIGSPGVPIPVHRPRKYWVTTGSEAEERELRRIVFLEIDEAGSHVIPRGGLSPVGLAPVCPVPAGESTADAQQHN
jgi:hypothetical protein